MQDVQNSVEEYNPYRKVLIVFDDMVADIISNKKLFISARKLKISTVFMNNLILQYQKILD